jgi:hypothetical protein
MMLAHALTRGFRVAAVLGGCVVLLAVASACSSASNNTRAYSAGQSASFANGTTITVPQDWSGDCESDSGTPPPGRVPPDAGFELLRDGPLWQPSVATINAGVDTTQSASQTGEFWREGEPASHFGQFTYQGVEVDAYLINVDASALPFGPDLEIIVHSARGPFWIQLSDSADLQRQVALSTPPAVIARTVLQLLDVRP